MRKYTVEDLKNDLNQIVDDKNFYSKLNDEKYLISLSDKINFWKKEVSQLHDDDIIDIHKRVYLGAVLSDMSMLTTCYLWYPEDLSDPIKKQDIPITSFDFKDLCKEVLQCMDKEITEMDVIEYTSRKSRKG